jgi:hypothetical protein
MSSGTRASHIDPGGLPTRAKRSRVPGGFLGMLVLIVCFERFVARHEDVSFTTNVAASWKQAGKAAQNEARRCEVLCFGDSMLKFGIAPRVIEARTGLSAYNLAVYGGPPPASFFLFRRALQAGARPRAVIVNFTPHLVKSSPRRHVRQWQEIATLRECLDLAWTERSPIFFAEIVVGRLLPSVRDRHEIRSNIMHALRGRSYTKSIAHYVTPLWRNWRLNRGAQLLAKNPEFRGALDPADDALFPAPWSRNRSSEKYVRRFIDLAAGRGIIVYWLLPPNSPASQEHLERIGVDGDVSRYIQMLQARYGNLVVVDGRHSSFRDDVFTDTVHLDRHGTAALSVAIAAVLRRGSGPALVASNWVRVPACPQNPIEVPFEDLDQSRLALKERAVLR